MSKIAIISSMVTPGLLEVRLTSNEVKQFAALPETFTFWHANLHHSATIMHPVGTVYTVKEILKSGIEGGETTIPPILSRSLARVKLIATENQIPTADLDTIMRKRRFIAHHPGSLLESIVERYAHVRKLSRPDILASFCYARRFRILEFSRANHSEINR